MFAGSSVRNKASFNLAFTNLPNLAVAINSSEVVDQPFQISKFSSSVTSLLIASARSLVCRSSDKIDKCLNF